MAFRLLHSADWHFDSEKLQDCKTATDAIITSLKSLDFNAHVIAGDIFNKRQVLNNDSAVSAAKEAFIHCANLAPTILIKGNEHHDNEGSLVVFRDLETNFPTYVTETIDSVILFRNTVTHKLLFQPVNIVEGGDWKRSAIFHLLSYPEKGWFLKDKQGLSVDETNSLILEELRKIFMGFAALNAGLTIPKILVFHGNVVGSKLSNGQTLYGQDIHIPKEYFELAQCDYIAGGHIHKAQEYYSGSIYHCNHGETERKQINDVRIQNGIASMIPIILPSIPLADHKALYDQTTGKIIDAEAQGELFGTEPDWIGAKLRIRITLTKEQDLVVTDEMIQAVYPGAFQYQIERTIETNQEVRAEAILEAEALRDKVTVWAQSKSIDIDDEIKAMADEVEQKVESEG